MLVYIPATTSSNITAYGVLNLSIFLIPNGLSMSKNLNRTNPPIKV